MEKIRVLVADDHPVYREGLCRFLGEEGDIEVVARPEGGEEAVRLAEELRPDVVIIDVAMRPLNGIDAARQIKSISPDTAILMLSAFGYESYLLSSLHAGAAGYMLKNARINDIISAVRMLFRGEAVFDLKGISGILGRLQGEGDYRQRQFVELHSREVEVLKLAAKGMTNKEIATNLGISERTVQTHIFNILRRLGVGSRTEAVLHALREGWFTLDDLP